MYLSIYLFIYLSIYLSLFAYIYIYVYIHTLTHITYSCVRVWYTCMYAAQAARISVCRHVRNGLASEASVYVRILIGSIRFAATVYRCACVVAHADLYGSNVYMQTCRTNLLGRWESVSGLRRCKYGTV